VFSLSAQETDDHVRACALAAQAEIIVSRDSDLLTLATNQGVPILKPVEALQDRGAEVVASSP
jgi:predicted nucleic acid-binding protein